MEWLWQVDDHDQPVGPVPHDAAHAAAIRHRSGVVFLIDAAIRIYLTRRAATKSIFTTIRPNTSSSGCSPRNGSRRIKAMDTP